MISETTRKKLSEGKQGERNPMHGTVSPTRKFRASREELYTAFITEGNSLQSLAEKYGVTITTIYNWLRLYDIRLSDEERLARQRYARNKSFRGAKDGNGYLYTNVTPRGAPALPRNEMYVAEHRLVVGKFIGRTLTKAECVHHINMVKKDNRIENLALFPTYAAHGQFHKFLERLCLYLLGVIPDEPAPLIYKTPILYAGQWVTRIDMAFLGSGAVVKTFGTIAA